MSSGRESTAICHMKKWREAWRLYTHLSLNKMAAISETSSSTFSWMCILIRLSLTYIPKNPIDKSALVKVMDWCLFGAKPLPEPMPTQFTDDTRGIWFNGNIHIYLYNMFYFGTMFHQWECHYINLLVYNNPKHITPFVKISAIC